MPGEPITRFEGDYAFLHNLYECAVRARSAEYPCAELAYLSFRRPDSSFRRLLLREDLSFEDRAEIARTFPVHDPEHNSDEVKLNIMQSVLVSKFSPRNTPLIASLNATSGKELIYQNDDLFWGVDTEGKGRNHLGRLLMHVRDTLLSKIKADRRRYTKNLVLSATNNDYGIFEGWLDGSSYLARLTEGHHVIVFLNPKLDDSTSYYSVKNWTISRAASDALKEMVGNLYKTREEVIKAYDGDPYRWRGQIRDNFAPPMRLFNYEEGVEVGEDVEEEDQRPFSEEEDQRPFILAEATVERRREAQAYGRLRPTAPTSAFYYNTWATTNITSIWSSNFNEASPSPTPPREADSDE